MGIRSDDPWNYSRTLECITISIDSRIIVGDFKSTVVCDLDNYSSAKRQSKMEPLNIITGPLR